MIDTGHLCPRRPSPSRSRSTAALQPISDGAVGAWPAVSWPGPGRSSVRLQPGSDGSGCGGGWGVSAGLRRHCGWASTCQRRRGESWPRSLAGAGLVFGRATGGSDEEAGGRPRSLAGARLVWVGLQAAATEAGVAQVKVLPGRGAVSVGVRAGSDGSGCGGGRGVLPGPGLTGLVCLRGRSGSGSGSDSGSGSGGGGVLSVRRAGPSGVQGRAGAGAGAEPEPVRLRWPGWGVPVGWVRRVSRVLLPFAGCGILGVCRCGRVHVRCHLLPVLRTAHCQLPIAYLHCNLRTVDWGQWAFSVCPSYVSCLFGVCASFGALPPVGVIPSGRSPAPGSESVLLAFSAWERVPIARGAYHASPGLSTP